MNGGMDASPILTADTVREVCGVPADRYRDFAALRGDPSDNLPGVHGVGGDDRRAAAAPRSAPRGGLRGAGRRRRGRDPQGRRAPRPGRSSATRRRARTCCATSG
jgi:hypothetical protein